MLLRTVVQDALSEVAKVYQPTTLKIVDDITAIMEGRNKELPCIADKILEVIRMEVEEKGLKLSITEGGKRGQSKVIARCSYLLLKFQECGKKEGVGLATGVDT